MKKNLIVTLLTFLAPLVLTVSCKSGPPSAEELASADYGSPISQEDAETIATAWLQSVLKDPDSLRAEWGLIQKGWQREFMGDLYFGYRLAAGINARNSFGGYVGSKPYAFLFYNGTLAHVWSQNEHGTWEKRK